MDTLKIATAESENRGTKAKLTTEQESSHEKARHSGGVTNDIGTANNIPPGPSGQTPNTAVRSRQTMIQSPEQHSLLNSTSASPRRDPCSCLPLEVVAQDALASASTLNPGMPQGAAKGNPTNNESDVDYAVDAEIVLLENKLVNLRIKFAREKGKLAKFVDLPISYPLLPNAVRVYANYCLRKDQKLQEYENARPGGLTLRFFGHYIHGRSGAGFSFMKELTRETKSWTLSERFFHYPGQNAIIFSAVRQGDPSGDRHFGRLSYKFLKSGFSIRLTPNKTSTLDGKRDYGFAINLNSIRVEKGAYGGGTPITPGAYSKEQLVQDFENPNARQSLESHFRKSFSILESGSTLKIDHSASNVQVFAFDRDVTLALAHTSQSLVVPKGLAVNLLWKEDCHAKTFGVALKTDATHNWRILPEHFSHMYYKDTQRGLWQHISGGFTEFRERFPPSPAFLKPIAEGGLGYRLWSKYPGCGSQDLDPSLDNLDVRHTILSLPTALAKMKAYIPIWEKGIPPKSLLTPAAYSFVDRSLRPHMKCLKNHHSGNLQSYMLAFPDNPKGNASDLKWRIQHMCRGQKDESCVAFK